MKQWADLKTRAARHHAVNPERRGAYSLVRRALKDGRLSKTPCESCNGTKKLHAHHEDYSQPLNVRWLCAVCHIRLTRTRDGDEDRYIHTPGRMSLAAVEAAFASDPRAAAEVRDEAERLLAFLAPIDRFIIKCRMSGCTHHDIGAALGTCRQYAQTRESKALDNLRLRFASTPIASKEPIS